MFKIIRWLLCSNERGRAQFVVGKVRDAAACPLPYLFFSSKVREARLPPSNL